MVRSCDHGNEPSGSVKGGGFLDQVSECWLPKKGRSTELVVLLVYCQEPELNGTH